MTESLPPTAHCHAPSAGLLRGDRDAVGDGRLVETHRLGVDAEHPAIEARGRLVDARPHLLHRTIRLVAYIGVERAQTVVEEGAETGLLAEVDQVRVARADRAEVGEREMARIGEHPQ